MGTVSYGQVYRESFLGTALIVGATYDMNIGKRLDIKLMNLMVYAPYVSYYNDVVLKFLLLLIHRLQLLQIGNLPHLHLFQLAFFFLFLVFLF